MLSWHCPGRPLVPADSVGEGRNLREAKASQAHAIFTDAQLRRPPWPPCFPGLKMLFPLHISFPAGPRADLFISHLQQYNSFFLFPCLACFYGWSTSEIPTEISLLEAEERAYGHRCPSQTAAGCSGGVLPFHPKRGCQMFWKQGCSLLRSLEVAKGTLRLSLAHGFDPGLQKLSRP